MLILFVWPVLLCLGALTLCIFLIRKNRGGRTLAAVTNAYQSLEAPQKEEVRWWAKFITKHALKHAAENASKEGRQARAEMYHEAASKF